MKNFKLLLHKSEHLLQIFFLQEACHCTDPISFVFFFFIISSYPEEYWSGKSKFKETGSLASIAFLIWLRG